MGMFEITITEYPTYSLADALEDAAVDYEQDFAEYWGVGRGTAPEHIEFEHWRELLDLHELARKFAVGAKDLVRPPRIRDGKLALRAWLGQEADRRQKDVDKLLEHAKAHFSEDMWRFLYEALEPGSPSDPRTQAAFFDTCMQLEAHRLFGASPAAIAGRMLRLVGVMIRDPGEFTRAYLTRVAECYIRDMKTEFAVMARAVLDVAIQEVVPDEDVARAVGTRREGGVDLERRIEACRAKDVFDSNVYAAASRVRERGNRAAHFSPGLEGQIDDALDDLALCLRALEAAREG